MPIRITDVSSSTGGPLLEPRNGSLLPKTGQPVVAEYQLAHWALGPGTLPVSSVSVTAKLFPHDLKGTTIWLAEVLFLDTITATYRCWRTYRVEMPNGQYDSAHDEDLKTALRRQLSGI